MTKTVTAIKYSSKIGNELFFIMEDGGMLRATYADVAELLAFYWSGEYACETIELAENNYIEDNGLKIYYKVQLSKPVELL